MKYEYKNYFSLIEVALAIGVLVFGATIILSMIPVGVKENRDSVAINYSANFANDIYSYLSSEASKDWSNLFDKVPAYNHQVPETNHLTWKNPIGDIWMTDATDNGVYGLKRPDGNFLAQANIWLSDPQDDFEDKGYPVKSSDISPANDTFTLVGTFNGSGYTLTSDILKSKLKTSNDTIGETLKEGSVHFIATNLKFKLQGNSNLPDTYFLNNDGEIEKIPSTKQGNDKYIEISSDNGITFEAYVSNDNIDKNGNANGQWHIVVKGRCSSLKTSNHSDYTSPQDLTSGKTPVPVAYRLNIEISWPIRAITTGEKLDNVYASRKKMRYFFDLFDKNAV